MKPPRTGRPSDRGDYSFSAVACYVCSMAVRIGLSMRRIKNP